ncbi:MAG: ABC transporter permease subunit [Clostridia bacterium]|nr:ABC transporter permease subunit [Clostridia bacterium]
MNLINYISENYEQILSLLLEHIELTLLSVILSILIGIPVGILISYVKKLGKPILGLTNVIQAIPSMALLGFMIPFLGIGTLPAIVMVILYSLLPIIKNTYTGIKNINEQTIEAATGIGLTKWQVLTKIQIPLAFPVIMAGIRISAVSAVGLMTLAAFVGAGGLGYLVYAGIRSVNNAQILAGAIPACLLALLIDYVMSIVETLTIAQNKKEISKSKLIFKKIVLALIIILTVGLFGFNYLSNKENVVDKITIGSMDFTEQEILSYMIDELIEKNTDIQVEQKLSLGSSSIVLGAIFENDIDMYIDYTGTIYGSVLKHEPNSNVQEVYNTSKKELKEQYDLNILEDLNFNNTYTLAVRKDTQEKYNLKTISDLSNVSDELTFSPTLVFMERNDCYIGLEKTYPINFQDVIPIDGSPRYIALMNEESDVIDAYSTDGLLKKFDLVVLEDDKNFFLPYHAIPVVNNRLLDNYPEIVPLLEKMATHLNDEVMRELNYKVDEERLNAKDVAHDFLILNNLISE